MLFVNICSTCGFCLLLKCSPRFCSRSLLCWKSLGIGILGERIRSGSPMLSRSSCKVHRFERLSTGRRITWSWRISRQRRWWGRIWYLEHWLMVQRWLRRFLRDRRLTNTERAWRWDPKLFQQSCLSGKRGSWRTITQCKSYMNNDSCWWWLWG